MWVRQYLVPVPLEQVNYIDNYKYSYMYDYINNYWSRLYLFLSLSRVKSYMGSVLQEVSWHRTAAIGAGLPISTLCDCKVSRMYVHEIVPVKNHFK